MMRRMRMIELPLFSTLALACGGDAEGHDDGGFRQGAVGVVPIEVSESSGWIDVSTGGGDGASTSQGSTSIQIDPTHGWTDTGDPGTGGSEGGGTGTSEGGASDTGASSIGGTWSDTGVDPTAAGDGTTASYDSTGGEGGDGWTTAYDDTFGGDGTTGNDDDDGCDELVPPGPFAVVSEIQAADFPAFAELTRPFPLGARGFANISGVPADPCTTLAGDGTYAASFENYQDKHDPGSRDEVSGVYVYFDGLVPGATVIAAGLTYDAAALDAKEVSIFLPGGVGGFTILGQGATPVGLRHAVIQLQQIDVLRGVLGGGELEGIIGTDERTDIATSPADIKGKTGGIHKVVFDVSIEVNAADEAANGAIMVPDPMKKGATIALNGMVFPNGCTGWINAIPSDNKGRAISNSHCVKEADGGMAPEWVTQKWNGKAYRIKQHVKTKPADVRLTFGWTAGAEPDPQYKGMTIQKIDSAWNKDIVVWDMGEALKAEHRVKYGVSKAARTAGTEIWVAGHGAGLVMKAGHQKTVMGMLKNASLVAITDAHKYQHNADTLGGNSGSPVILRGGADVDKVTCLHHAALGVGKLATNECTSFDEICKIAGFKALIDGC